MNLSRNNASLLPPLPTVPPAPGPRLPNGRLTASVRRGLGALGWVNTTFARRDLRAALRWLNS